MLFGVVCHPVVLSRDVSVATRVFACRSGKDMDEERRSEGDGAMGHVWFPRCNAGEVAWTHSGDCVYFVCPSAGIKACESRDTQSSTAVEV